MKSEHLRHLGFALFVVVILILVRILASGPEDLADLERFRRMTGIEIGPNPAFFANGLNGDGATFAVIAADPLGSDVGAILHSTSYRYLRFGYPWIGSAVVLGNEDLLLLGLSAVGLVSAGATAYLASVLSAERGWWAWLLVLNPAMFMGVMGDTAEPLALSLLGWALFLNSTVLALLVAPVRPTYLVALAARWRLVLAAGAGVVLLKAIWSWRFSEPLLTGSDNVSWPFVGVISSPSVLGILVAVAGLTTAVVGVMRRDLSWVVAGVFTICFGPIVASINAVRAAGFLPLLWAFGPRYQPRETSSGVERDRRSGRMSGSGSYPRE